MIHCVCYRMYDETGRRRGVQLLIVDSALIHVAFEVYVCVNTIRAAEKSSNIAIRSWLRVHASGTNLPCRQLLFGVDDEHLVNQVHGNAHVIRDDL